MLVLFAGQTQAAQAAGCGWAGPHATSPLQAHQHVQSPEISKSFTTSAQLQPAVPVSSTAGQSHRSSASQGRHHFSFSLSRQSRYTTYGPGLKQNVFISFICVFGYNRMHGRHVSMRAVSYTVPDWLLTCFFNGGFIVDAAPNASGFDVAPFAPMPLRFGLHSYAASTQLAYCRLSDAWGMYTFLSIRVCALESKRGHWRSIDTRPCSCAVHIPAACSACVGIESPSPALCFRWRYWQYCGAWVERLRLRLYRPYVVTP